MKFNEVLKKERIKRQLSIRELSKISGVNASYISRLERGVDKNPGLEVKLSLAKALKIDVNMLLDTNDDLLKAVEYVQSSLKKKYGNSKSLNQIIWDKTADIYENAPTLDNVFFKEYNDLKYDKEPSAYFTLFQVLAEIYAMELALKAPRDKVINEREEYLKILKPKLQDCINDLQDYIDAMIKEKFRKVIDR